MNNLNGLAALALLGLVVAPVPMAQGLVLVPSECTDTTKDIQLEDCIPDTSGDPSSCEGTDVAGKACINAGEKDPQPPPQCDEGDTRIGAKCVHSKYGPNGPLNRVSNLLSPHQPCPVTKDDDGFGGTHATCYYACKQLDLLGITVTSGDTKMGIPDVSGYTDCGGAKATCPRTTQTCGGEGGPVTEDDSDKGCVGRSYEAYSSPITVACVAAGRGIICQLTGLDCGSVSTSESASQVCKEQNPGFDAVIDLLVGALPGTFGSFVTFQFTSTMEGVQGIVVQFDGGDGQPTCWAGPM